MAESKKPVELEYARRHGQRPESRWGWACLFCSIVNYCLILALPSKHLVGFSASARVQERIVLSVMALVLLITLVTGVRGLFQRAKSPLLAIVGLVLGIGVVGLGVTMNVMGRVK